MPQEYEIYHAWPGGGTTQAQNNETTLNRENHEHSSVWTLWRQSPFRG